MNLSNLAFDEFSEASLRQWREAAEATLKGAPFEKKLLTALREGLVLQPLYNPENSAPPLSTAALSPGGLADRIPNEGEKPAAWQVAQEIPYGIPKEFNRAALSDLLRGQNALSVLLDVATRRGQDPDQAKPFEVAQCGLSLPLLEDFRTAFDGIYLEAIPIWFRAGASPLPVLAAFAALAAERELPPSSLQGGVLADPLTERVRDGSIPMAPDQAVKEIALSIQWLEKHQSPLRILGINGAWWADAGANAVQELAFSIATFVQHLRDLTKAGCKPESIAARTVFDLSIGSHIFLEIAKFRALRLLWWNVTQAFGIEPIPAFIHARGLFANKSTLDPHTNMLRATAEGFAGAMGGVDSMHISIFDETIRPPDEFSRRIARNVHAILAEECGFADVSDPSAGSWFVESLTRELAEAAWNEFQEIEGRGGMANALHEKTPQTATARSASDKMQAVAKRKDGMVGVNLFPNPAEKPLPHTPPDDARIQADRAARTVEKRTLVSGKLDSVEAVIEAWRQGVSIAGIRDALGRSEPVGDHIQRVRTVRFSSEYESLRRRALHYTQTHDGNPPTIWLANFGPPRQHRLRADFSAGFFAPGGFVVRQGTGANSVEEAAASAAQSGALAVTICSTDETYPEIVPAFAAALRKIAPSMLILLAGNPGENAAAYEQAGVRHFIHIRTNCLEFNQELQETLDIH